MRVDTSDLQAFCARLVLPPSCRLAPSPLHTPGMLYFDQVSCDRCVLQAACSRTAAAAAAFCRHAVEDGCSTSAVNVAHRNDFMLLQVEGSSTSPLCTCVCDHRNRTFLNPLSLSVHPRRKRAFVKKFASPLLPCCWSERVPLQQSLQF